MRLRPQACRMLAMPRVSTTQLARFRRDEHESLEKRASWSSPGQLRSEPQSWLCHRAEVEAASNLLYFAGAASQQRARGQVQCSYFYQGFSGKSRSNPSLISEPRFGMLTGQMLEGQIPQPTYLPQGLKSRIRSIRLCLLRVIPAGSHTTTLST